MSLLVVLLAASASAADFASLLSDTGWTALSTADNAATGPIAISSKTIAGVQCLRGTATVSVPAQAMHAVVTDIPSAKQWSSETLLHSRTLATSGKTVEYFQHLDVPGWTMASDRYWVLRGEDTSAGETKAFRWDRFDWKTKYPALVTEVAPSGAVEPVVNYGAWTFTPSGGQTALKYYICTDPGGSLPEWLKETAATQTLPNTVADVVKAGKKRAG